MNDDHPTAPDGPRPSGGPGSSPAPGSPGADATTHLGDAGSPGVSAQGLPSTSAPTVLAGSAGQAARSRSAAQLIGAQLGTQIGPYTLLSVLGEGGFGVVFLAERTHPIRQRVAIKVIKPGMDSAAVVARFELERRSLAMMDHPNVARVLDAGTTPGTAGGPGAGVGGAGGEGRPYFVMEYVPGEPITAFCDRQGYSVRQRIGLMTQVCDAVQHAHLKGLIHRDLKPGNIIVESIDGVPIVKVIDFGIAKAIQPDAARGEAFTLEGMLIGTPEYMSPEQAGGELDIDTRTDIYSLGVVLYELLAGVLPFDGEELRSRALAELQRIIREVDPPRPSARLSELYRKSGLGGHAAQSPLPAGTAPDARASRRPGGATAVSIAAGRGTAFKALERTLRRELEWIPLKAMRKDRDRRYNTAQEFRDDLQRYLRGEPLLAGPESRVYRVRKFASRNRGAVAAGVVVLASIVAAAGVSIRFGLSERRARVAERAARVEATTQRDVAQSVNDFLNEDLFGAIDPEVVDPDVKVADVLDIAARKIDASLRDKPAVRARVLQTLGDTYLRIGRPEQSRPLLERARELGVSQGLISPDDDDRIVLSLNECLWRRRETDAAMALLEPAVARRRARLGDGAKNDGLFAELVNNLGGLHKWAGRYDDAAATYAEALDIRTRVLGPAHADTLGTMYNLVGVDEARERAALFKHAAEKDKAAMGADRERLKAVRERMRAMADRCREGLGADAPLALAALAEVGYLSNLAGEYEAGVGVYAEVIPRMEKRLSDRHWRTLEARANLADAYRRLGRHGDAVDSLTRTVELYREVRGPDFEDTISLTRQLADSLEKVGKPEKAVEVLERCYSDLVAAKADPDDTAPIAGALADLAGRRGLPTEERRWRDVAASKK